MINICPLTLTVRAVCAAVTVHGGTFVKVNAIMLQGFNQNFYGAGDLPLGIGVLNPKKEHTAGLVCHTFTGQTLDQIAQMDKAGRRGSHPGDDSALRKITGRETLFKILRGLCHVGKKKIC